MLRILLVEDNPGDVLWFRLTLDELKLAYQLTHHDTARKGLVSLRESRPDIAFIDLNLPGMTGEELLAELRQEMAAGLPVCVLTGSILERERIPLQYGINPKCYVLKPITHSSFLDALACFNKLRPLAESLRSSP
jgi:CheY-like chemotaxis protein